MNVETLAGKQNPDGGWPYVRGASWTEPSVYAILAMLAAGEKEPAARGIRWLSRVARRDGGFAPQAGVADSTWVTALVALLPPEELGAGPHKSAIQWLIDTTGNESTAIYRLRQWMLGVPQPADQKFMGWPWTVGAAAWVGPTSLAILALEKESRRKPAVDVSRRLGEGQRFLIGRCCHDGGWNHGAAQALGYSAEPYPETTGMALAALRGVDAPEVRRGIGVARRFLAGSHSADAINWLTLGLMAHGELPGDYTPPAGVECRTLPETSLAMLMTEARKGRDVLWG
ncbi:MAG TPA: prenyltransferase/squalene oxidase repeat-containing protein [Bryobacteraceae bacterium]|nr:prenyltransferase/squalene oxidase repeat-containing protein [Bryobacteraceae bacterium]